jgi:hypothetical protein
VRYTNAQLPWRLSAQPLPGLDEAELENNDNSLLPRLPSGQAAVSSVVASFRLSCGPGASPPNSLIYVAHHERLVEELSRLACSEF